jgi:hypothetical protein
MAASPTWLRIWDVGSRMVEERSSVALIVEVWKLIPDVWAFLFVTYVS